MEADASGCQGIQTVMSTMPTNEVSESGQLGLLQPIRMPNQKWQQITTDLVTDLPQPNGYTAVAVFVDRLTTIYHFAPCTKDITNPKYARLFVDHVFRLHEIPEVVI